jgi:hypothetical protein
VVVRSRDVEFLGHSAIEVVERGVRMLVVYDVGPRIAWFGRDDNVLFWDDAERGSGQWRLYGGHRLWLTRPGADESEETYLADDEPCDVKATARSVVVTAPVTEMQIEKSFVVRAARGEFTVEHRVCNRGQMLWSGGAWALTCTRPARGTRYRIPLGGGSSTWDVTTLVIPTRWGGTHTSRLDDPQFELASDALLLAPRGIEAKRMIGAPQGTLEMIDRRRGTFRKRAPYVRHASYPLGTNLAVYVAPENFMVELETMSPIITLAPGESFVHVETWQLLAAPKDAGP